MLIVTRTEAATREEMFKTLDKLSKLRDALHGVEHEAHYFKKNLLEVPKSKKMYLAELRAEERRLVKDILHFAYRLKAVHLDPNALNA